MSSLVRSIARTGLVSGLVSTAAALALSRRERGRATPAMNAVSHIAWGGYPPAHAGAGGRNFVTGTLLHLGASTFWAVFFETLFGRRARASATDASVAAATIAAAACVTDYGIVPKRLRPGMEAFLSAPAIVAVYASLALGFFLAARWGSESRHAAKTGGEPLPSQQDGLQGARPGRTGASTSQPA